MRKAKSLAKSLTDDLVDALGRKWPTTMMNWDTSVNGKFVPWTYVKQALAALDRGDLNGVRACLMRPLTSGLEGGPDVTGIIGHASCSTVSAGTLISWEIKAGADSQSPIQKAVQRNIERHGGIYIVVKDVDQGIEETMQYAGPGEK